MNVNADFSNSELVVKIIDYYSEAYQSELLLRNEVLRKPLGMNLFDEDLTRDSADIHIAAFIDNSIVGCMLLLPLNAGTLKMRQVAVAAVYQSKGIGITMVRFAEKHALSLGYTQIVLHARLAALNFYLKQNYQFFGEEFYEVGIPHRKMIKNLIL
ncbi:MAG: GNAT family N-acetyltransferase [Paludibacteraceae bacterium]|nr:GNAT family N-acetyltransferase [Paludibacteraceae bacterium]